MKIRSGKEVGKDTKKKRISKKKRRRSGKESMENVKVKKVGRQVRCK